MSETLHYPWIPSSYWALNIIQRKRILQQSGILLKQNLGEAL